MEVRSLLIGTALLCTGLAAAAQTALSPSLSAPAQTGKPVLVDAIAAVVNDQIITKRDVNERMRNAERQLQQQNIALPSRDVLEKQVLERAITERAILSWARENNVRVDEQTIDAAFTNIAQQNGLSVAGFRERLVREGVDPAKFRRDLRDEIILSRARSSEVEQRIQISESEIDDFLAQEAGVTPGASEINIAQILIRASDADARGKADALAQRVKAGEDFAKLARENSASPEASAGGEFGFRAADRLPELFVQAVEKLKPGEVTGPIQSPAGFHILKLVGKRAAGASAAQAPQIRARHILVRPGPEGDEGARKQLNAIRERVASGQSKFEDEARKNSVDGSAAQGGDLGWLMAGETVPEFERAMDALKPGEISQPVRSQFGWHLIQVQERGAREIPMDKQRNLARNILRERKADEQFAQWAQEIRGRAYVEVRQD
ncbi:MAG: peptidylprolyl isomerase [Burkholderiaceae bacterium]